MKCNINYAEVLHKLCRFGTRNFRYIFDLKHLLKIEIDLKSNIIYDIIYVTQGCHMSTKKKSHQDKLVSLQASGTLNFSPEKVQDPIFQEGAFFDPMDIVQVKYELIRRVQTERASISDAAKSFGFSRISYYRIQAVFEEHGLSGLVPQKRGPKQAHKISAEVLEFMKEQIQENPSVNVSELKAAIEKKFKLSVHPRTIERTLIKKKKVSL
jgi:transposase